MKTYPIPPKKDFLITQHNITRNDEYYWMRERENPQVVKHLEAENEYLEKTLSHIKPLQETLFQEMKNRIKEVDSSVPEKNKDYFYYTRTEADKQYPIYCRKKESLDAPEEILLDQNELAEGHEFCSVSAFNISPDQNKLAYSLDVEGSEVYIIYIKDLMTGKLYPEKIEDVNGSVYYQTGVEWAKDSQTIFYIKLDEIHRASKLYRHKLGTHPKQDVLLFDETDDTYSLSLFKTRSEDFIMTYHASTLSQEMRFLPTSEPDSALQLLQPRQHGLEYYATHHGDSFYIITNKDAYNYKLVKAPVSNPSIENWKDVIPHRDDVLVEYIDVFENHLVLHERKGGLKQLRLSRFDNLDKAVYIQFPDPTYEVVVEYNLEYKTDEFRIRYSSLVTPTTIANINLDSGAWSTLKVDEIAGFDQSNYACEFIFAEASDGKKIPMSIAYKKGQGSDVLSLSKQSGKNPTLIYGYGAYGANSEAHFNSNLISILDRGFVFAIAHVRGGSEMGRAWYDEGKMFNKKNSFTDLIACAEHLIKEKFTSPEKIGIVGSSAGGLLVGASMVLRPDLFNVVICKVPFVDVITSMSDPTIPLTTLEYDQWGHPEESKQAFDYMFSYSPYDNLKEVEYPNLLLTTGFNDPRVAYWEPAKFLARIRDKKKGNNLALLQTNFSAGHAGASGRYDFLKENALDFAFLIDRLVGSD